MGQVRLTSLPPSPPGLFGLVVGLARPFVLIALVFVVGLPGALKEQLLSFNLFKILSLYAWRDAFYSNGTPYLLKKGDEGFSQYKRQLISQANGVVLEVGAGSGETLKYYEPSKITALYALEPYEPFLKPLARAVAKNAKLESKTKIVPLGIQERSMLRSQYGLQKESVDTLVLVQCFCSIQSPKSNLRNCVELLKPGGKLLMFEHVCSPHPTTRLLQDLFTPIWRFFFNGCEINRDTIGAAEKLSCWSDFELQRLSDQTTADMIPHVFLTATKKK